MIDKLIKKYEELRTEEIKEVNVTTCADHKPRYEMFLTPTGKIYQEILQDLKELKGLVRGELYGQDMTISEYEGACDRLIGKEE